jgi:hypothetical protein
MSRHPTEQELVIQARLGRFPVSVPFIRNRAPTPFMGATFGQDIEPAGEYMVVCEERLWPKVKVNDPYVIKDRDYGYVTFENPLVIEHVTTGPTGWKRDVARMFGQVGKNLTRAMMRAGYDGILTYDGNDFSEIVRFTAPKRVLRQT